LLLSQDNHPLTDLMNRLSFCVPILLVHLFLSFSIRVFAEGVIDLTDPAVQQRGEAVLFSFDGISLPFRHGVQLSLVKAQKNTDTPVLLPGPGPADAAGITFYGTVIRIGDKLHMWYLGKGFDAPSYYRICYAFSMDGRRWTKPALGLVDYGGNRENNLVDLDWGGAAMSCNVIYEPDDPNPKRHYKMFCEVGPPAGHHQGYVAFSPDGLHWTPSTMNPVTHLRLEPTGLIRKGEHYILSAQNAGTDRGFQKRVMINLLSADFETWTTAAVLGFRRDLVPPREVLFGYNMGPQVHLGAALADFGHVVIGLYGQWNGPLNSNDRREMRMNIGLVTSGDGLHFSEPIPDYPLIEAYEDDWSSEFPSGTPPRLSQGQGLVNIGDQSLTWFGIWGPGGDNSIRLAYWDYERFGFFSPVNDPLEGQTWVGEVTPHVISAPILALPEGIQLLLNVEGPTDSAFLVAEVLDNHFQPIPGYTREKCHPLKVPGFQVPVSWGTLKTLPATKGPIRLKLSFEGSSPEKVKLYAAYLRIPH